MDSALLIPRVAPPLGAVVVRRRRGLDGGPVATTAGATALGRRLFVFFAPDSRRTACIFCFARFHAANAGADELGRRRVPFCEPIDAKEMWRTSGFTGSSAR